MRAMRVLIGAAVAIAAIAAVSSPVPSLAAEFRGSPVPPEPSVVVRVDAERGLVTARASEAPLREVLEALEHRADVRFRLADPRLGDHRVTYDVREEPKERLLEVLLRGFSYVVRHDGSEQLVTIVAGPPPTAAFRNLAVSTPSPALVRPGSTTDVAVTARREAGRPGLDAHVRRVHEAQLLRSLVALDTRAAEDRQYHLETLVGQDDPGATETLVRDAVFEPSPIPEARREAVRRLWRHAAARGFVEDTSVAALGQVAEDGDEQVAEVAREALEDLRRYHGASLCDRSRSFAAICPSWASER